MQKPAIVCCKFYISHHTPNGGGAVDAIAAAAVAHPSVFPLLHTFHDRHYNRVGYTFAASLAPPENPLRLALLHFLRVSLSHLDLRLHSGSHPRLGVLDHICFHPLASAPPPAVASLARSVASDIASQFSVPTYLYGAAHPENRSLDSIRRALGYFSSNGQGQWVGAPALQQNLAPDFGAAIASPKSGVVIVGASPWIENYNIPVSSNNLQLGRRIARRVSTRGGGLPAVQAIALLHGEDQMEIACNLIDSKLTSADVVQAEVARLAQQEGLLVESGYFTDYSEDQITEMAYRELFPRQSEV